MIYLRCNTESEDMTMTEYNLREHILPTSEDYGFGMDGYWLWCGSAIKGEDGLYH